MEVPRERCFISRMAKSPRSGAEKLRVYRLSLTFSVGVGELLKRARCTIALADQLRRAADSILLNVAEGAAYFRPAQKAQYYRTARASAAECAAALTRIGCDNPRVDIQPLKRQAAMIAALLLALIRTQENRQQNM
jgi:four helix bundle protein